MRNYDFIYGSKVLIQCQAQINILPWNGNAQHEFTKYLTLVKKDVDFFSYWCKPRHVVKCMVREPPEEDLDTDILDNIGTEIDDFLIERDRALTWSKTTGTPRHVPQGGHGKIQVILKAPTFCARDMGVSFDPCEYSRPTFS